MNTPPRVVTPNGRRHSVSLCMIVRDEAKNLAACLAPVHALFDEIVIVDTGSTDETREIARGFNARVIDFPWVDDFSAARNESLRQATGDYIFWLDADDRLDGKDIQELEKLFQRLDGHRAAHMVRTVCTMNASLGTPFVLSHPRLFRADPKLTWRYRVHEQIMPCLEELRYEVNWSVVQITHQGYSDAALVHRKVNRDLQLLLLDYLVFPHDPCILFHLGKAYARLNNFPQALVYLLRSLHYAEPKAEWVARLYVDIVAIMITLGRKKEALSMTIEGLSHHTLNPALMWRQAQLLAEIGELQAAEQTILRLLGIAQQEFMKNDLQADDLRRRARRMLGSLQLNQNRLDEAEYLFQQMIAEKTADTDAWIMLGYVYLQKRYWQKAESVARQLRKLPQGEALACCMRAEIAKLLGNLEEARSLVEQAITLAPRLPLARILLAEVLDVMRADVAQRRRALSEVLRVSPGHRNARQALEGLNQPSETLDTRLFNGVAVASTFQTQT